MEEEKIILPAFQIAELYKTLLVDMADFNAVETTVESTQAQPGNKKEKLPGIKHLGENGKNVLILINQAGEEYGNEKDLSFLTAILKACYLILPDIAIVNTAGQWVTYTQLKEQLHPQQILLFDVEPAAISLPFMVPFFQVQKYDDIFFLVAPPLMLLNEQSPEGKLLKTKLWMSLRKMFELN